MRDMATPPGYFLPAVGPGQGRAAFRSAGAACQDRRAMPPTSPPTSPYSTRFKLVAVAVLAVAVALFVGAFLTMEDSGDDPVLSSTGDDAVVENLIPRRNSQVPQQSTIGIDLVPDWTGTLVLNGTEI